MSLDYDALREKGIRHLEQLAAPYWTDFNAHDPGITILEQCCYALTDLLYRSRFPVVDLLCREGKDPYASLFGPAQALTSEPVTLADLRSLLIDLPGVGNAWVKPLPDAQSQTLFVDANRRELHLHPQSDAETGIALRGLYSVVLEKSSRVIDLTNEALRDAAARCLHAHRELCADVEFSAIRVLDTQWVQVLAELEIGPAEDPQRLLAILLDRLDREIAPSLTPRSLAERLTEGLTVEEVFEGPRINQGFIETERLARTERRSELRISDLIRTIMDVEGVRAVRKIALKDRASADQAPWALPLDDDKSPKLDLGGSSIRLDRGGVSARFDGNALESLRPLPSALPTFSKADLEPSTEPGRDRQVGSHQSLLHHFPQVFGVGPAGLPATVGPQRRAQAKQLKAYLLLFDQIMAQSLAQLAHVPELLGFADADPHSYFPGQVEGLEPAETQPDGNNSDPSSLGLAELLQKPPETHTRRLRTLTEPSLFTAPSTADPNRGEGLRRKHLLLDHLLARHGEHFADYSLFSYGNDAGDGLASAERLIHDKRLFLRRIPALSGGRGRGFDRLGPDGEENVSGLEMRLRLKLGISDPRLAFADWMSADFQCAAAPELLLASGMDAGRFIFQQGRIVLTDSNGAHLAVSLDEYPESEADAQLQWIARRLEHWTGQAEERLYLLEHLLLRPTDGDANQHAPLLVLPEGEDPDPYSLQLSVVLPEWPVRFASAGFAELLEQTVAEEVPAHLRVHLVWMDQDDMAAFESVYPLWRNHLREHWRNPGDHLPLRDARDRLVELLQIGLTYPLTDTPVNNEHLKVTFKSPAKIVIPYSQPDVRYSLGDKDGKPISQSAKAAFQGNGGELVLTTLPVERDTVFTVRAEKLNSGNAVVLNTTVEVKVGLNTQLAARVVSGEFLDQSTQNHSPTDARIVDFANPVTVEIANAQEGVDFSLIYDPAVNAQTPARRGDGGTLNLDSAPLEEDTLLRITAVKSFDPSLRLKDQQELLDVELPIKVRPNPNLKLSVNPPDVDFKGSVMLSITATVVGTRYQVFARPIGDNDWIHLTPTEGEPNLPVTAHGLLGPLALRRPIITGEWITPEGFAASGVTQSGNGGTLTFEIKGLVADTLFLVRAEKRHGDSPPLISSIALRDAAAAVLRPVPDPPLRLRGQVVDGKLVPPIRVSGGQPGVFYHFRAKADGPELGPAVYFHQADETDPAQNRGVNQLAVEIDLAVADTSAATETDPSRRRPPDPVLDCPPLAVNSALNIRAVKAQTGAELNIATTVSAILSPDPIGGA